MPHVSMAAILWGLVVYGFMVNPVISQQSQNHSFKAGEVFVIDIVCDSGKEVDAGTPFGNWKRVLFPSNSKCQGNFRCTLTFRYMDFDPHVTDICVDFSRMKIEGRRSVLRIENEIGTLKDRLNQKRYPLREKSMNTVFCTDKRYALKLIFRADCDKPLKKKFNGWMYVFVQSSSTGNIFFVDGGARHHVKMNARGHPRISLRSHMWAGLPYDFLAQKSTLRLSVHEEYRRSNPVCFEWNPSVAPTMPRGVEYKIFKAFISEDYSYFTYANVSEGEVVKAPTPYHDCYPLGVAYTVVAEVRRDMKVPVDSSWDEKQLLFDIVIGVNNEGNTVYGPLRTRPLPSTTTTMATTTTTFTPDEPEEEMSFWEEHKLIIGLFVGGLVLAGFMYLCCKMRCSDSKDDSSDGEDDNMMADTPRNDDVDAAEADNRPREPEAYPMMPRASPSAPSWNEVTEDPAGEITEDPAGDSAAHIRTCDPPSYQDLFPEK
ncbi:uncharacterized protein LOC143299716 [Babylonia areolata]|uniref:uncharacterized protein LOC143299716 n=1 Tax=Babylonia areolata TaxID=304850 RepID=UPI003FD28491